MLYQSNDEVHMSSEVQPSDILSKLGFNSTRYSQISHYLKAWCEQSECCEKYAMVWGTTQFLNPSGWGKIHALRKVLTTTNMSIVYFDNDAFVTRADWCPSFGNTSLLVAPDPNPYTEPFNAGFLAVQNDKKGKRIMDYWWDVYKSKYFKHWQYGGVCFQCLGNRQSCTRPCVHGGKYGDQGTFNEIIYPHWMNHITILPKGFQDTSISCNGTVKHFPVGE